MTTTPEQLATDLDVTLETIHTLIGQIDDDPDLYDPQTGQVTIVGAELIAGQVASQSGIRDQLTDLADAFRDAQRAIEDGKSVRAATVRLARDHGASWQQIADAFGLASREHARRIANEDR